MATSRTKDYRFVLGTESALTELTHILGGSVSGDASVTNEAFLNQEVEASSVHTVMESVSISNMYDSAQVDTVLTTLLPSGDSSGPDAGIHLVIFQDRAGLETWQGWPVSFARPGFAAPPADAITMPWDLMQSGRGGYGTTVVPLSLTDGTAATILGASASRGSDPVLYLVLTEVDSSVTEFEVDDGSTELNPAHNDGIFVYDISSSSQALTITASGGTASGFALVGSKQRLAADSV